jgi:hypothetical protein
MARYMDFRYRGSSIAVCLVPSAGYPLTRNVQGTIAKKVNTAPFVGGRSEREPER